MIGCHIVPQFPHNKGVNSPPTWHISDKPTRGLCLEWTVGKKKLGDQVMWPPSLWVPALEHNEVRGMGVGVGGR